MLPYVEVSDLPVSASFYSAITHPLGLRYLSATSSAIVYGESSPDDASSAQPVFEVRKSQQQDTRQPRRHSLLVLSAASESVVSEFHAAAGRAHPDLLLIGAASIEDQFSRGGSAGGGERRAKISDFDGNTIEVVYVASPNYASRYEGSTVRRTQSTTHEVSRILDWNLGVVTSHPAQSVTGSGTVGGALVRRPAQVSEEVEPYILRRSVTTSTIETGSPRLSSDGLNTGAVVGTVLGAVAAGAAIGGALTYMGMRRERERAPHHEFEAPAFQRRSTYPDPYPEHRPRYVEVERTVEKVLYPEEYPPVKSRHYPPPSYMARYSQIGSKSREVEELDDRSSRHSSSHSHSTGRRTRTRSEAGSIRQPLMITGADCRSYVSSKHSSTAPKMMMEPEHHSHTGSRHSTNIQSEADMWSRAGSKHSTMKTAVRRPEVETYISTRSSQKSDSTIKPPRPLQSISGQTMSVRSKAPRGEWGHSVADIQVPGASKAGSYASARMVPLPGSRAGSRATWDDDNDSIAPSESISCIGSRRSGRLHH